MDKLKELFSKKDILEDEIRKDIIDYRRRTNRSYSFKEASIRYNRWNYIIFRRDFKKYLQDNKQIHLENLLINLNSKP